MKKYSEPQLPSTPLDLSQLDADPFAQFHIWFKGARNRNFPMPHAMSLATSAANGVTTLRTVLLKDYDQTGFIFFTNYGSRKSQQIEENPNVSLLFPWISIGQQIIIVGTASKVSRKESLEYFKSRPRGSQIGAWTSNQSRTIESRKSLEETFALTENRFKHSDIPLPDFWGGYRVIPDSIEFWQNRADRLHDRFLYKKSGQKKWEINRLSP
ncbi:MAG: pyridoxamine 5'-phosphate oxidase [Acidiferrobacteraceae bacterium]|nr:pyridoxamine 5'-phosphate oxidase [Acidiferrobacteraceae bacterium]